MDFFTEDNEENKDSNLPRYRPFLRFLCFLLLVRNQGTLQKGLLQKAAKETKICSFSFKDLRYLRFLLLVGSGEITERFYRS